MPAFRRQSAQRRRTLWRQRTARTAKPCGPGRRCYGQALANAAVAPTGAASVNFAGAREARRNSAPGRARHKPSDHRAGKAVCWASPVCCCAVLPACAFRAADRGCRRHPAFPAPSWLERVSDEAKLGRIQPREREGASSVCVQNGSWLFAEHSRLATCPGHERQIGSQWRSDSAAWCAVLAAKMSALRPSQI